MDPNGHVVKHLYPILFSIKMWSIKIKKVPSSIPLRGLLSVIIEISCNLIVWASNRISRVNPDNYQITKRVADHAKYLSAMRCYNEMKIVFNKCIQLILKGYRAKDFMRHATDQ